MCAFTEQIVLVGLVSLSSKVFLCCTSVRDPAGLFTGVGIFFSECKSSINTPSDRVRKKMENYANYADPHHHILSDALY